jgi:hypothetical protein
MFWHELNKLVDFNDPWSVLIDLFQNFFDLLIRVIVAQRVHQRLELSFIDATWMVAVKNLKGLAEDFDLLLSEGFLFFFVLFLLWLAQERDLC